MKESTIGLRYYKTENDIKLRKHYLYINDALVEDPYKANNRIASAYYKMLVDQKVNYLLGKKPTLAIEDEYFFKMLNATAIKASAQGIQWAYPYIKNDEFKIKLFDTDVLEPQYNDKGDLVKMYRKALEKKEEYLYVYDAEEIRKYKGKEEKGTPVEVTGHISMTVQEGAISTRNYKSWGMVPFFPMKNNEDGVYDLQPIKGLIDTYDIVLSDFANNLEDFQDVTWILKGYQGQDVGSFINDVKKYKTMKVGEGGDAKVETIDVPYQARMEMLNKGEKLIFKFGFGVDMEDLSGGSLTNVAIESQFSNLDMKCNGFSSYVTEFIESYVEFYNVYAAIVSKPMIVLDGVTYNKSTIMNEVELLDANAKQYGFVSEETRLENNPWVDDVKEEMDRMQGTVSIEGE